MKTVHTSGAGVSRAAYVEPLARLLKVGEEAALLYANLQDHLRKSSGAAEGEVLPPTMGGFSIDARDELMKSGLLRRTRHGYWVYPHNKRRSKK